MAMTVCGCALFALCCATMMIMLVKLLEGEMEKSRMSISQLHCLL